MHSSAKASLTINLFAKYKTRLTIKIVQWQATRKGWPSLTHKHSKHHMTEKKLRNQNKTNTTAAGQMKTYIEIQHSTTTAAAIV